MSQNPLLYTLCITISTLSVTLSFLLLSIFLLSPRLKNNPQLIPIAYLSLSDLIWALWAIICYLPATIDKMKSVNDISKVLCKGVGVFGNFGALSSFFWYYIITNNCIAAIKGKTVDEDTPTSGRKKHTLAWGLSLFLALLPLIIYPEFGYGPVDSDGYECWIPDGDGQEWVRISYYGPLLIIITQALYLLSLVIKLTCFDWKDSDGLTEQRVRTAMRIIVFVSVFVVVWGEALVSRFVEYWMTYDSFKAHFPYLEDIHIIMKGSAGLINGVVWLTSSVIREEVKKWRTPYNDREEMLLEP
ncbi:hypothetical protein TL16_g06295 [Triparma laevis f. inornata]|uniref:G-protein coupled receptors family 2 profile 2 domain-containing protein n=2 Tax=Triparma laevis TaxID=1534972 RepID=A0A9W7CEB7_9STRA|nr:hypothetical protein TL16_g06295 [Triparma laevis f. inornata]GMI03046.1 hypothetical protein TrLO_g8889 [Triparma laevis f. longispina]